jgi:hypothetical protein
VKVGRFAYLPIFVRTIKNPSSIVIKAKKERAITKKLVSAKLPKMGRLKKFR